MTTMMSDQEAEGAAQQWLVRTRGELGEPISPWRGTWAEHVVRGTTPEHVKSLVVPVSGVEIAQTVVPEGYQDDVIPAVWGMLTKEPREVFGRAMKDAIYRDRQRMMEPPSSGRVPPPLTDPQVSRALALVEAANGVVWDYWYPPEAKFYVGHEGLDLGMVKVIGWMLPQGRTA
jgi:hypothetical protein